LDAPHQPVLSADGAALLVVEFGPSGRLLRIDLTSGAVEVVVAGLERPVGFALSPDETTAFVTEQAARGGRITRVDMGGGATSNVPVTGLVAPFFLAWADGLPDGRGGAVGAGTYLLVAERDPANRVSVINIAAPTPVRRTVESVGFRPSSAVPLGD